MLRLPQPSLGLLGLAFAVSASAMMLVLFPDEAAAKILRFSKHQSSHSADTHSGRSKHREHASEETAQASGGDGPGFSVRPKGSSSSADEEKNSGSADVSNDPGAAPAAAAQETSSMTPKPSSKSAPDSVASPVVQQPTVAETKANAPGTARASNERDPATQHPVAAAHPGMDVVVCEAGCTNASETTQTVYIQVSTARDRTASVGEVQPTSTAQAARQDTMKDMIVCIGGCYDTPKVYRSTLAGADVAAGTWTATVVPTNAKPSGTGSGNWMRRIDASRGTEPAKSEKQ